MEFGFLKPDDGAIARLARQETDPHRFGSFQPIARGPLWALLIVGLAGLGSLPWMLGRALRQMARRLIRR